MASEENSLSCLIEKKAELSKKLYDLEKQIYNLEESYLIDTQLCGNIVKGWDDLLNSKPNISKSDLHKTNKCKDSDRIFSMSSVTSPLRIGHFIQDLKNKNEKKSKNKTPLTKNNDTDFEPPKKKSNRSSLA